ncbi:MAG: SAM-dependent methyltransferase [Bacteroidetes bacterium]|nr:SAM-dependent methyltransferase [Bacteroidota bacterium]
MTSEFWNDRFGGAGFLYGSEPNEFLKQESGRFLPGGRILSLGEGEGRNAVFLGGCGYKVTASDSSTGGFLKLRGLAAEKKVTVQERLEDVVTGNWDTESWDGIVNIFCHIPSAARREIHRKIKKSLLPGGLYVTEQFSKDQLSFPSGGPKDPDYLCEKEEFDQDFRQDFDILVLEKRVIYLDEGFHKGDGSVIRFIGQKR